MKKCCCLLLALVLTLCLPLAGPGVKAEAEAKEEPVRGGTLVVREYGDPMSFCPDLAADDNGYAMFQNMYNRLTKLDASKKAIPDAAKSWDITDEGKTITFHLRDDIHWWDGKSLTADDVKYTFDYIKGHDTCYFSSNMDIVDEIEVVDPQTVVFHMNKADVSFVSRIGWYATFILPKHIYDNGQEWADNEATKTTPMGSGPFKLEKYEQGKSMTLLANPDYHEGAPYLDKLIFQIVVDDTTAIQALINGELDHVAMVPAAYFDQLNNDPGFRLDRNFYPSPWRYIFNLEKEPVKDLAVRKAIAYCIDRNDMSQKVTKGIMPPEWTAYPEMMEWCVNKEAKYPDVDIDAAIKTLEDAGYTKDKDGYYVRGVKLDCFEGDLVDMSRLLVANAKKAGIEIELVVSEFNAWATKVVRHGDWIMEAQGGFMGPDPAALYSRLGSTSNDNYASWENAKFDELCEKGAAESDTEKRTEYYKEAQQLIIDELPAINVLGFAAYEVADSRLRNLPIDGTDKWGWNEYTFTYFAEKP